jgi:hypothetical protein
MMFFRVLTGTVASYILAVVIVFAGLWVMGLPPLSSPQPASVVKAPTQMTVYTYPDELNDAVLACWNALPPSGEADLSCFASLPRTSRTEWIGE